jgi:threonine/homoserine/homoserine lactone efflux protein
MYGAVAAFGLTSVSSFLVQQRSWMSWLGGAFLCWIGIQTFRSRPAERPAELKSRGVQGAFASTFGLTLANPMTALSFVAIFAGLGVGGPDGNSFVAAVATVTGVFLGSALWWLGLTGLVGRLRDRLTPGALLQVNRASGVILLAFGLYAVALAWRG